MFKAVSEGATEFTAVAIASEKSAPWPCGACRQVLNEFAPGIRVLVTWDGHVDEAPLSRLLPHGFGQILIQQTLFRPIENNCLTLYHITSFFRELGLVLVFIGFVVFTLYKDMNTFFNSQNLVH